MRRSSSLAIFTVFCVLLNGCAGFPRPAIEPELFKDGDIAVPLTSFGMGSDAELDIEAGFMSGDVFLIKRLSGGGILPAKHIRNLTLTESGIHDALRLMIKDTGLSLNIEGGPGGSERFGPVSLYDVNGNLTDVLDQLSEAIGFFYTVKRNTLHIQQEQDFVVEIPPALNDDNAAGLTNTLQFLGAKDFYLDRINRSLVFKTNRKSLAKIEEYLKKVRDTRSMIVYDVNIFQVDLRDNAETGIQWNQLAYTAGKVANAATGTLAGLGMGIVLSGSHFTIDTLITFLRTQGNVKAVSRPRLAILSGTKGTLRIGQATTFVSKVGTNSSSLVNQVTTETKDLKTGLDLSLFGDFSDNTIYTRIGLTISEIIALNKFTALGTDLTLPQISDRELNTVIRARPGDMILLGGITIDRDAMTVNRGITINGSAKEVLRSELVLTLKTKIINFRGKTDKPPSEGPASQAPRSKESPDSKRDRVDTDEPEIRQVILHKTDVGHEKTPSPYRPFLLTIHDYQKAKQYSDSPESTSIAPSAEKPGLVALNTPLKLKISPFVSTSKK
jgi:MSHA biogenesis protein MshL